MYSINPIRLVSFVMVILLIGCSAPPNASRPSEDFLNNTPVPSADDPSSVININPDFNMNKEF